MQRRNVIKLLASSAMLAAMPGEMMLALQEARAQTTGGTPLRTLNPHQNETVVTLGELIIPATDTPGAKAARVNEFIDLLLTDWFDRPDAEVFLNGLNKVDTVSRSRFKKDFIACTTAQQIELLKQWDDEAIVQAKGRKSTAAAYNPEVPPVSNFFYTFKKLTLVGYYTSEIGFSQELGKQIIPAKHDGCAPIEEATSHVSHH